MLNGSAGAGHEWSQRKRKRNQQDPLLEIWADEGMVVVVVVVVVVVAVVVVAGVTEGPENSVRKCEHILDLLAHSGGAVLHKTAKNNNELAGRRLMDGRTETKPKGLNEGRRMAGCFAIMVSAYFPFPSQSGPVERPPSLGRLGLQGRTPAWKSDPGLTGDLAEAEVGRRVGLDLGQTRWVSPSIIPTKHTEILLSCHEASPPNTALRVGEDEWVTTGPGLFFKKRGDGKSLRGRGGRGAELSRGPTCGLWVLSRSTSGWVQSRPQDELVGSAGELAALRGRGGRPEPRTTAAAAAAAEPAARPFRPAL
ncbi:unnamed protein product [Boreogadus saida]